MAKVPLRETVTARVGTLIAGATLSGVGVPPPPPPPVPPVPPVPPGPDGAAIVKDFDAAPPVLPAVSTARTAIECPPAARPLIVSGLVHVANVPPSRLHSKRATSRSGLENVAVADVPLTATSTVALGAVVSSALVISTLSSVAFAPDSVARYWR